MDYLLNDDINNEYNSDSENSIKSKDNQIKTQNKRYQILKLIGEGSFSKTYSAKDNLLDKSIAIFCLELLILHCLYKFPFYHLSLFLNYLYT